MRAANTTAAAAVVLFCVCRQQGNDVRAFTFSPPPSAARPAPISSSPSSLRRGGEAGLGALSQSSSIPSQSHRVFEHSNKHSERAAAATAAVGPLRAAAGDGKDGAEEEGEWRRFGSGRLEAEEEEEGQAMDGSIADDVERIGLTLPEISNPFKAAFEAGQTLRSTLADTLGQITGTASPVRLRRRG